jgi:hypothetical protein
LPDVVLVIVVVAGASVVVVVIGVVEVALSSVSCWQMGATL